MIPQCLWGQDYCANEYANRDRLQQWVNYDRMTNKNTLQFNQTQLADAEKAWKACQLKEFGAAPKVTTMDDGELLTFPNGTCFKPRDSLRTSRRKVLQRSKKSLTATYLMSRNW